VSVRVLCETAVVRLGVGGATLTVDTSEGWSETRHATDTVGGRLAELQVTVGEGPCVDARREGGPVLVADLDARTSQQRWPLFAPLAVEAGARALFTLPMCVGAIRVGTLSLHRTSAGPLDPAMLGDSVAFATLALALLLDGRTGASIENGNLASAGLTPHSPQVHQATGMISAQLDVGIEDAFARLRARAFADQRPLGELASDVVSRRLRFGPRDDVA
jgi:hypothetical protein